MSKRKICAIHLLVRGRAVSFRETMKETHHPRCRFHLFYFCLFACSVFFCVQFVITLRNRISAAHAEMVFSIFQKWPSRIICLKYPEWISQMYGTQWKVDHTAAALVGRQKVQFWPLRCGPKWGKSWQLVSVENFQAVKFYGLRSTAAADFPGVTKREKQMAEDPQSVHHTHTHINFNNMFSKSIRDTVARCALSRRANK